jgi:hypothetical protein
MTDVKVMPLDEWRVGVEVEEGSERTSYTVTVPQELLDDLVLTAADAERLVWETFQFLLEREKATEISPDLSLDDVGRRYPEYRSEIAARVAA